MPIKQPSMISLVCPQRILRVNRSITITAQVPGGDAGAPEYSFHWGTTAGTITPVGAGNKALFTAPGEKCTAEIKVDVKDKNNAVATQTVSIIVFKQLGFIKADDVACTSGGALPPLWQVYLDYMALRKIKSCAGLIGNSMEKGNADYIDRLKKLARLEYFEIFNHGYDHVIDKVDDNGNPWAEFSNTPLEQQKEHLIKTQNLAKEKLDITLHTFGAPGNSIDANTTKAMEAVEDLGTWLYGNPSFSKLVLSNWGVIETSTGYPDYNAFSANYDPSVDYYVYQIHPNGFTTESFNTFKKILDFLVQREMTFLLPYEYYILTVAPAISPELALSRAGFNFGSDKDGHCTPSQVLRIENNGDGVLNWAVSGDSPWITIEPSSGTAPAEVNISVKSTDLNPGTYHGAITVQAPNALNSPGTVSVTLEVLAAGAAKPPFGEFSTPIGIETVCGSIPVTGWVLDDIAVTRIKIYNDQTYIGDGIFVEGARPDVEAAYPGYPQNYRAGWGYMLLTNCLPGGGNGIYTLNVFAVDVEGHEIKLGSRAITIDNKNAVKPFGAIDTPTQGGVASGSQFINHGWVLTPAPNRVPVDGSTIHVWVDGIDLGKPVYNIYRTDIENLFPGYANSSGAAGYFILDTTKYKNGLHTIAWTVKDSAGNEAGVGSRFFVIKN